MSGRSRGGKFLETAHVPQYRPRKDIGSKFPELGPLLPERDDCAPPLVVCGRCSLCRMTAARRLAALALAEHQFDYAADPDDADGPRQQDPAAAHADRADALRTSLLALGILAPGDTDNSAEETAA